MKPERTPIRRPLFDAPIYPGEDPRTQERGIPLAGASIFATPEGKARTFGPDAYARFVLTPEKGKKAQIHALSAELVDHPSYVDSLFSFTSEIKSTGMDRLTSEIIHTVPDIIRRSAPLSERQARELLTLAVSEHDERKLFAQHVLREYVKSTTHLGSEKKDINLNTVTKTQSEIVDLLHSLVLAGLEMKNKNVYRFLYDVLSFKTPILELEDPQAGLFAIAGQSPDDNTLAKAILLDQTAGLLEQLFATKEGEYPAILISAAKKSQQYTKPFLVQNAQNKERDAKLLDFFTHRYQKFGTYLEEGDANINEFYTRSLPFPENIIYVQSQKMWPLFLDLCSEIMISQGRIKSPIVQFALPDGSLRYVAEVDGHSEEITRDIISYALNETHFPPEVYDRKVIETFLRFTTPELSEHITPEMERLLTEKKQALLHPVRGIHQGGIVIRYKDGRHIAATSLSIDASGKEVLLRMGNYSLHLRLNQFQQLLDSEGHVLDIPEESRIWWETVILAPLKELVCPTREDGVLIGGTEDLSPHEAVNQTKKKLFSRVGHLRRLPPGEGYTVEQAMKSQEVLYPLPGIERLDLEQLNKELGFTRQEGQYTYVLPQERNDKNIGPITIHTPHAFDDLAKIMSSK